VKQRILITGATNGFGAGVAPGLCAATGPRVANLGAGTSPSRNVARMARHRITTESLLQDIERQRADEASSRWDELSREFMQEAVQEGVREDG
jgi:NAD(P)-dependent dehydrogenase (short-subunit alcohol dehydrogenase family)